MKFNISMLFIFLCASVFAVSYSAPSRDRNTKPYRVVCYYAAWAFWRDDPGKFAPKHMDVQSCTHIIYAFAVLRDNRIVSHDPWQDFEATDDSSGTGVKGFYRQFNNLRQRNPQITTLIALGGWEDGRPDENHKYSIMAENPATRKIFVDSVLQFLKEHDFDGMDFDWEYPVLREGISRPQDKVNFITVLKELSEAFEPHGYLLTAAVAAGKTTIEAGYDIPQVNKYLDFINVMAYDFHGAFDNYTGHNSPMYSRSDECGDDVYMNVDYAINHWIKEGADRNKLILGIPLYGRCHTLRDMSNTGYGSPSAGNGTAGRLSKQPGMMGYNELCLTDKQEGGWTSVWNDCHLAPYIYRGNQWCSYDTDISVRIKTRYARAMGLGGAMVWSIDTDDFQGHCSGKKFPLLSAIVETLEDPEKPQIPVKLSSCEWNPSNCETSTPTTTTTRTTPSTTTSRKPGDQDYDYLCNSYGVKPIENECFKYVQCVPYGRDFIAVVMNCPEGTAFNAPVRVCDYPFNVPGCS